MKRGFTIIEIIISLVIILSIGVSVIFVVINNKKDNNLINISKQILEAANLYINIEKDE